MSKIAAAVIFFFLLGACRHVTTDEIRPAADGAPAMRCIDTQTKIMFLSNHLSKCEPIKPTADQSAGKAPQ